MINIDEQTSLQQDTKGIFITYNITNHAYERYAQRMVGKDNPTDIRTYINNHKKDIQEWISKLINYGELLYEGRLNLKDNPINQIYFKDYWIIFVDPKNKNVITLYRIDFGDEEVNKLFVQKKLEQLDDMKKCLSRTKENVDKEIVEYQSIIDNNELDIKYYRSQIKSLKAINEGYEILIKNSNLEVNKVENEISKLVDSLVMRRTF